MAAIRRDFLPKDLLAVTRAAGVAGVITVQARQSVEETRWLLELAAENDFIRGVVGWVPLATLTVEKELETFAQSRKLRGVRHVLQGEPDDYMLRTDFNRGIALLRNFGLRYDILIFEKQLPTAIEFVDRHPNQPFILDHIAKPKIKAGELEPWRKNIKELAKRSNVTCKVSGMVTEANWHTWTPASLRPYFETVLEAFTPRRLMIGSDWPVCQVACTYDRWLDTIRLWTETLSAFEREAFFKSTALEAYGLR